MDKEVIDYEILVDESTTNLIKKVKKRIVEGWQLFGSPFCKPTGSGYYMLCQAMVYYKKS